MHPATPENRRTRLLKAPALWLLVLPVALVAALDYARTEYAAPNQQIRIVATLTSWGLTLDDARAPVDQADVQRHIAMLQSSISEQRVESADWLASRGIRAAGAAIAAAMEDPQTRRPCQLAKSLGSLGDPRWAGLLRAATRSPGNVDLRVCATSALGELGSPDAVDALIDVYTRETASTTALVALGKIAHPSALPFLQSVAANPRSDTERRLASEAIARIWLMQQPDPATSLIERVQTVAARGGVDAWAVRQLAVLGDARAVPTLQNALVNARSADRDGLIVLSAGLLAHGDAGIEALRSIARSNSNASAESVAVAHSALALISRGETIAVATTQ